MEYFVTTIHNRWSHYVRIPNGVKIQSTFFITLKLIKFIFDSVKMCVDSADIQPHAWHTFLYILNSSQFCVNIVESWRISGWRWLPATCFCGNGMSSYCCSCSWSGLPNYHTPLTLKIFIFFMFFFSKKLFHPNVIDDSSIKFMSYNNIRCVIKQSYKRGISLSRHFIMCCMV